MFWICRLDNYSSRFVSAPSASTHLSDQLEGAFIRSEIRKMDHPVSAENSHQTYMIEVESLCHHLSTHQDVGLAFLEIFNDRFVSCLRSRGIEIHPLNLCILKMKG